MPRLAFRPLLPTLVLPLVLGLAGPAVPTAGARVADAAPSTPAAAAAARAKPDTLFPRQGHTGYDVRHYDVGLRYEPVSNRLEASTAIRAVARTPLRSFRLDFVGMTIDSVTVGGVPARWRRTAEHLIVTPRKPLAEGRFVTTVAYSGTPSDYTDADGSQEGWVRTVDGAVALGEPVGTMTWIPSNNTPADKARYTFRIDVPNTVQATANGNLVSRERRGLRMTWTWQARDRMSTYLAMVAIGSFNVYRSSVESITGRTIPLWSFVDRTTDDTTAARALLPKVMRFQERLFGAYPMTSGGMVVDNASVGYALETQTRPFYPFSVDAATLVHETAHQWYGNSVTLRDWHDIWLAEGFATYAEWLWEGAHGGKSPAERFDALYATPADQDLWHPAPTEFTSSADLFGEPVYNRGAMTLHALRERIGDTDFFRFIKRWATVHRQANVSTSQLVSLAEQVSGEQLDGLFADWLELDGRPTGY
ncbi:M1 family metallopeptidase [Nocardioides psychrotolerans]|uniref:M1 family metallopeptidase n=1 Tax=Nocardioides psychrotolerans TaxID=1005945 RepID=UPI00313771AD